MNPRIVFPRFPERRRRRARPTHHIYELAGADDRSRHRVPVTVPDKLRVEVSNALGRGRCQSRLSSGPWRGGRAQAVSRLRAPPLAWRAHSVPGSAAAEAGSTAGAPSLRRPCGAGASAPAGLELGCCSLRRMAAGAWAGHRLGNKPSWEVTRKELCLNLNEP